MKYAEFVFWGFFFFFFVLAHDPSFTLTMMGCVFLKEGNIHIYGIIVTPLLNTVENVCLPCSKFELIFS